MLGFREGRGFPGSGNGFLIGEKVSFFTGSDQCGAWLLIGPVTFGLLMGLIALSGCCQKGIRFCVFRLRNRTVKRACFRCLGATLLND